MKFNWFRLKAESNLKDHGVSFEEAAMVFDDPLVDIAPDVLHHHGARSHAEGEKTL
jgi:hypothetical protein